MSSVDKAKTVSRERRDCAEHALPVPRATLADREARELGIEPLDAATATQFGRLGADSAVAAARATLQALSRVCKACGGGAAYLETRPELDFCTPECAALAASGQRPARRISSVLEVDLGTPLSPEQCRRIQEQYRREHDGMSARETMNSVRRVLGEPTLPEDRAASDMFDGDEPPEAEPVVDITDYVSGLERDAQAAHLELQRVTAENDALRTQLIAALDRVRELESARREGGV